MKQMLSVANRNALVKQNAFKSVMALLRLACTNVPTGKQAKMLKNHYFEF